MERTPLTLYLVTITAGGSTITDDITLPASTITSISVDIIPIDVDTLTTVDIIATITLSASTATITSVDILTLDVETITTVDIIATITVGPTTTCNKIPGGAQPTFSIQAVSSSKDGKYSSIDDNDAIEFSTNPADATLFTFNSACNLIAVISSLIADVINDEINGEYEFDFEDPSVVAQNPTLLPPAVCDINSGFLQCEVVGATFWFSCPYPTLFIFTAPGPNPNNCVQIEIRALF
jgi:hypothetical protein